MRTISKNIGQLGYDEEVRNSLNDAAIELPLVNSGFTFKGDHNPTISEYPATPTIGDVWVIIGVTGSYTFTAGDLIGRDVVNGNQIVYGTSWSILNYNEISLSEYNSNKALWQNQAVTHNITVDADYTLTTAQNTYGRIIITDTGVLLTGSTNIIINTIERSFIAQNDTAQTLTFKTSAGSGVAIAAGKSASVLCDATDIIIVDSNYSYSKTESDIQRRIYAKETVTHEIITDADYILTADQNLYGRIVITDTVATLTGAINIIIDTTEREFIAVNSTAQILTFKTSAGTGIAVGIGKVAILQCDGTNVILNDTNYAYSKTEIDSSVVDRRKLYAKETFTRDIISGDVTAGKAIITLTAAQNLYGRIVITDTGGLTSVPSELILDSIVRDLIVINNDNQDYKVWIGSGGFVTVKPSEMAYLYCDGANVTNLLASNDLLALKAPLDSPSLTGTPTIDGRKALSTTNTNDKIIKAASSVVTTSATGNATVNFSSAFPSACTVVTCINGDATTGAILIDIVTPYAAASFNIRATIGATGAAYVGSLRVDYIAIGY